MTHGRYAGVASLSREELEALSRKEIQQLAIDAQLKANQKTVTLVEQLVILAQQRRDGAATPSSTHKTPLLQRTPLADVSNRCRATPHMPFGSPPQSTSSPHKTPLLQRTSLADVSNRYRATPHMPIGSPPQSTCDELSQQLAMFSLDSAPDQASAASVKKEEMQCPCTNYSHGSCASSH